MDASSPVSVVAGLPAWQQRMLPLAIALLRVTFGLLFLSNGIAKLPGFEDLDYAPFPGFLIGYDGSRNSLASDTNGHPIAAYRNFVDNVILENFDFFGPLLTLTEIGVGVLLVAGAFASAAALVGFLSLFHIWFANWGRYGDRSLWAWEGPIEWLPLLALCFLAAGRFYGIDATIARRLPVRLCRWPFVG